MSRVVIFRRKIEFSQRRNSFFSKIIDRSATSTNYYQGQNTRHHLKKEDIKFNSTSVGGCLSFNLLGNMKNHVLFYYFQ
jgi:hypothetical protein